MESRREKYYTDDYNTSNISSRSSRNARLYRQVYGRYKDLDNLPMDDNTDEIDMDKLKELVSNLNKKEDNTPPENYNLDILETKKRNIDEQKVYDINKLLEKAKYENDKLKEPTSNLIKKNRNILSTLESSQLSVNDIKKTCKKCENNKLNIQSNRNQMLEDNLSMTREMKYQTKQISIDPLIEQVMPDNDISLDLLSDLKPTGNTITTKPLKRSNYKSNDDIKENIHSEDTKDIDVIKKTDSIDTDFFTNSYQFSKKDFSNDDDFSDKPKNHNILKIMLLIIAILIFVGVIFYFIKNYGIGI